MNPKFLARILAIAGCLLVFGVAVSLRAQSSKPQPSVVGWNEGEVLLDRRGRTTSINVSPATGSTTLGLTTQDMPAGTGIPVHRHDRTEELLFIHSGEATMIVGDERIDVEAGTTIYVPAGAYHGLENPESNVQIVGIVTPPGLEQAFREMFWHPGEQPKILSEDELAAIGLRFDNVLRPD